MKVWVTRDNDGDDRCVMSDDKPELCDNGNGVFYSISEGEINMLATSRRFKEAFGFTPRKGSCKQGELTFKEIAK